MTNNRRQTTDKIFLAVIALTFIAFILRMYRLDFFSLRGDEAFTVVFVQRTWEGLWRGISTIEPNPPLLYLTLRGWIALGGASEFVARYFSVWFGVLCVPLVYRLAKEMFASSVTPALPKGCGASVAMIAAALIAVNPYQIWHSQDVRNYALWPALSLLALIFFWRWWKAEKAEGTLRGQKARFAGKFTFYDLRFTNLVFYDFATLATLYTHYYEVFLLAAVNLFVFGFAVLARQWKTLARWIGAQVVLVLLYAPWVLFGTNRITKYGEASAEQSVSLFDVFRRTLAAIVVSETVSVDFRSLIWIPLALAVAAILIYLAKRHREQAVFLFLCIAIPTLALYIVSIGRPLFLERYLNGAAAAYYLAFAVGIAGLRQIQNLALSKVEGSKFKIRPVALAIATLFFVGTSGYALWNYQFNPDYAKAPKWRELAQTISAQLQPGDIIVQNFTEMSPFYYLSKKVTVLTLPKDYWFRPSDEQVLRQLNADYRRIWFIPALPGWWDPDQIVEGFLSRNNDRVLDTRVDTLQLQLYLTPREFESKIVPVNARVGNATLTGYRVEGNRPLHIVLYWRADQRIEKEFTVFVHLADANDQVIAQQDRAPVFGTLPTTAWQPGESIVDAYDLRIDAPGNYSLSVGMYDPATLVRVPAFDANGTRLPNDRVMLTHVTIPQ